MSTDLNPMEKELLATVSDAVSRSLVKTVTGGRTEQYIPRPNYGEQTESQKRWLSWNWLVETGRKKSYAGTVSRTEIARRRAANKRAKASRKANR